MMKNGRKFKNSLSGRLTVGVVIVSAIIFTLTCTVFIRMAANKVREEATKHAHSELSNTIHQIDAVLKAVEIAVENTAWLVPYRLSSPDFMYSITERVLQNNEFICGAAVAFEPHYYTSEGLYFSPYSYRDENGEINSKQLGNETYDYHYMDWYQIPKLLNEPYWSEPYYDDGYEEGYESGYSDGYNAGREVEVELPEESELVYREIVRILEAGANKNYCFVAMNYLNNAIGSRGFQNVMQSINESPDELKNDSNVIAFASDQEQIQMALSEFITLISGRALDSSESMKVAEEIEEQYFNQKFELNYFE